MSRRRYRFNTETQALEEIGADWTDAETRAPAPTEALTYDGMRATDGTDISSRRKHREYLKATGFAMASDYTEKWAKASEERAAAFRGDAGHSERRNDVGRALYNLENQARRRK